MVKRLTASVRVLNESGVQTILEAGSPLPSWADDQVTNPAAFEESSEPEPVTAEVASELEGEAGQAFTANAELEGVPDYGSMSLAELQESAVAKGLPKSGTKAELAAALADASA